MQDHLTPADRLAPHDDKLERAVRYLRERGLYVLDAKVKRLPVQRRAPSVLDRWASRRSA